MDEDTFCLLDRGGAGIFIFTSTGKLVNQINYFGQAPHESQISQPLLLTLI